nr:PREDICTED: coiled-coil domain-containing protein 157-like [Stegastes partitus]
MCAFQDLNFKLKDQIEVLEQQAKRLRERNAELVEKLIAREAAFTRLESRLKSGDEKREEEKTELLALQEKVRQVEERNQELQEKNNVLEAENADLRGQKLEAEAKDQLVEGRTTVLQLQVEDLQEEKRELVAKVNNGEDAISSLETLQSCEEDKGELLVLCEESQQLGQKNKELQENTILLEAENVDLRGQQVEAETKKQTMEEMEALELINQELQHLLDLSRHSETRDTWTRLKAS